MSTSVETRGKKNATKPGDEITNATLLDAINKSNGKLDEINKKVTKLSEKVEGLEDDHTELRNEHDDLKLTVSNMQLQINQLMAFKDAQTKEAKEASNKAVMLEYHNKKYNSILYNWPENKPWESADDTRKELNKFLTNVLNIEKAEDIMIGNCHRLGAPALNADGSRKGRPLIFRVLFWSDRDTIIEKSQKLLKNFNKKNNTKYGVAQQLPKRFQDHKNSLMDRFRQARKDQLKCKWKLDHTKAVYYLTIDDEPFYPKADKKSVPSTS